MTAKHLLDQIVRCLDGVTAWLPKRRWERMTAAEPWLTNIVYSEDQVQFFECVPLYSAEYVRELEARAAAAEATVTALQEALKVAEEALEPFAEFADGTVDEIGWTDARPRERISTWFGPSDFRRARTAYTNITYGGRNHE